MKSEHPTPPGTGSSTTGGTDVFSVWWFDAANGAQRAVHRLEASRDLEIRDACIVSWPEGQRRPIAWQSGLGGLHRLAGAFWGLLVSWLFLLPISRSPSSGAGPEDPVDPVDDLGEELTRLGLDARFAESVRTQVVPGTSAIFLLSSAADRGDLQTALTRGSRCIARHQLSLVEQEGLHAGFDD